jgi:hypothetical protein
MMTANNGFARDGDQLSAESGDIFQTAYPPQSRAFLQYQQLVRTGLPQPEHAHGLTLTGSRVTYPDLTPDDRRRSLKFPRSGHERA